jgi:glycogen debranching enzyme
VDTLTSNIGHLLGTGLLNAAEEARVARLLGTAELNSGYGLRTMATGSAGYWPLRYHGGSVWAHDTAIAIAGLARSGHHDVAARLADGLLAASQYFGHRLPELYSGDAKGSVPAAVPYPAACRPQAWSAASAMALVTAFLGLSADVPGGMVRVVPMPGAPMGAMRVTGLRVAGEMLAVETDATGAVRRVATDAALSIVSE